MFRLYSEERAVFTFDDYGSLMEEVGRCGARSVLEFGPGASTLALVEAGCERIVTCEYQDRWLLRAVEMLKPFPQVSVHRYRNAAEVTVDGLPERQFDLAFVDSPLGIEARMHADIGGQEGCSRLNTLLFALGRAPIVLFHDAKREGELRSLERVIALGHTVDMIDTIKGMARVTRGSHD